MRVRITASKAAPSQDAIVLTPPPDKSILHRLLVVGSLTQTLFIVPVEEPTVSHDVIATVLALESLGVSAEFFDDHIELQGVGLRGYRDPSHLINCANSGTTARLLTGVLAGQNVTASLVGDASLSRRPMRRLTDLLVDHMGARIHTSKDGTLPLIIEGQRLHGASIDLSVASAQIKTALLLAGLNADGPTRLTEPHPSRDHTELMLGAFGVNITTNGLIELMPGTGFELPDELEYPVPGDLSSGAFILAAAALLGTPVVLENVGLNPTRTRYLEVLTLMGVHIESEGITSEWGEDRGRVRLDPVPLSELIAFTLQADDVALLIDEIPILCVMAAFANGTSQIHGASELRRKESDRIRTVVEALRTFGVDCAETEDGLTISGNNGQLVHAAGFDHADDHRIAMAFAVMSLLSETDVEIANAEIVRISYPEFFDHLRLIAGDRVSIERSA